MVDKRTIIETITGFLGPSTISYPKRPSPPAEGYRGKPEFDEDKCVGCGGCAQTCPMGAIEVIDSRTRSIKLNYGKCSYCGRCENICPVEAIHLTDKYELAYLKGNDEVGLVEVRLLKCSQCGEKILPRRQLDEGLDKVNSLLKEREITKQELKDMATTCSSCRTSMKEMVKRKKFLLKMK